MLNVVGLWRCSMPSRVSRSNIVPKTFVGKDIGKVRYKAASIFNRLCSLYGLGKTTQFGDVPCGALLHTTCPGPEIAELPMRLAHIDVASLNCDIGRALSMCNTARDIACALAMTNDPEFSRALLRHSPSYNSRQSWG